MQARSGVSQRVSTYGTLVPGTVVRAFGRSFSPPRFSGSMTSHVSFGCPVIGELAHVEQ